MCKAKPRMLKKQNKKRRIKMHKTDRDKTLSYQSKEQEALKAKQNTF